MTTDNDNYESNYVIKFQLKPEYVSATQPVRIWGISKLAYAGESHTAVDTEAVINGHTGTNGQVQHADDAFYLDVKDEEVYTYGTSYSNLGPDEIAFHVVLETANETSSQPLTLLVAQEPDLRDESLTQIHPYLNNSLTKIIVPFPLRLDPARMPDASAFRLSSGTVTGVTLNNVNFKDYLILDVSGLGSTMPAPLTFTYAAPANNALTYKVAADGLPVPSFEKDVYQDEVDDLVTATISADRTQVTVVAQDIRYGNSTEPAIESFKLTFADSSGQTQTVTLADLEDITLWPQHSGYYMELFTVQLPDWVAAIPAQQYTLEVSFNERIVDWCFDPIKNQTIDVAVVSASGPEIESVIYYGQSIYFKFTEGIYNNGVMANSFVLETPSGTVVLRGELQSASLPNNNGLSSGGSGGPGPHLGGRTTYRISLATTPVVTPLFEGEATLRYIPPHTGGLVDLSGKPLSGFAQLIDTVDQDFVEDEATKYETAVTIPSLVAVDTDITDRCLVLQPNKRKGNGTTITVHTRGEESHYLRVENNRVYLKQTAPSTDVVETLIYIFTRTSGDRVYTATLEVAVTIKAAEIPVEDLSYMFEEGYPRLNLIPDDYELEPGDHRNNRYSLEMKLKPEYVSAANPVRIWGVMDYTYADSYADTTAVINGHTGAAEQVRYANDAFYYDVVDSELITYTTKSLSFGYESISFHLVLETAAQRSEVPVTLTAVPGPTEENSFFWPTINSSLDRILIDTAYDLDPSKVPDPSAFQLSTGSVNGVTVGFKELNYYVALEVSGIGATMAEDLTLSYTAPAQNPLTYDVDGEMSLPSYQDQKVYFADSQPQLEAYLSADRSVMTIIAEYIHYDETVSASPDITDFALIFTDDQGQPQRITLADTENVTCWDWVTGFYTEVFTVQLPAAAMAGASGDQYSLEVSFNDRIVDQALEPIRNQSVEVTVSSSDIPEIESVVYYGQSIYLKFSEPMFFNGVTGNDFMLKTNAGEEVALRGFFSGSAMPSNSGTSSGGGGGGGRGYYKPDIGGYRTYRLSLAATPGVSTPIYEDEAMLFYTPPQKGDLVSMSGKPLATFAQEVGVVDQDFVEQEAGKYEPEVVIPREVESDEEVTSLCLVLKPRIHRNSTISVTVENKEGHGEYLKIIDNRVYLKKTAQNTDGFDVLVYTFTRISGGKTYSAYLEVEVIIESLGGDPEETPIEAPDLTSPDDDTDVGSDDSEAVPETPEPETEDSTVDDGQADEDVTDTPSAPQPDQEADLEIDNPSEATDNEE